VRKAPGLPAAAVRAILDKYAFTRGDLTWDFQWRLAIGVAIGAAFKLMARYADMRVVRYDDGAFTDHGTYIWIYVSERVGYMRADLGDRLRASWSIGL